MASDDRCPDCNRLAIAFGATLALAWSPGLAAQEVGAARTPGPIEIDGVLDEAAWSEAGSIEAFTQLQPVAGAPASQRTAIRILYDERMVYFGIESRDTDPDAISRTVTRRDGEVWEDDAVALVLDTFDDDNNAYVFMVNSLGTQQDERWADNGRTPGHHLGRQLAIGRIDERSRLVRRGRHPLRNGSLRAGNLHLGLQRDPLPPQESGAEPLDSRAFRSGSGSTRSAASRTSI